MKTTMLRRWAFRIAVVAVSAVTAFGAVAAHEPPGRAVGHERHGGGGDEYDDAVCDFGKVVMPFPGARVHPEMDPASRTIHVMRKGDTAECLYVDFADETLHDYCGAVGFPTWVRVVLDDGTEGWVASTCLRDVRI